MNTKDMTEKEYYKYRLEMTRRGLMELIAKCEAPYCDELSEILIEAVNRIEELQNDDCQEGTAWERRYTT